MNGIKVLEVEEFCKCLDYVFVIYDFLGVGSIDGNNVREL